MSKQRAAICLEMPFFLIQTETVRILVSGTARAVAGWVSRPKL
jgi:hypothetical protein